MPFFRRALSESALCLVCLLCLFVCRSAEFRRALSPSSKLARFPALELHVSAPFCLEPELVVVSSEDLSSTHVLRVSL